MKAEVYDKIQAQLDLQRRLLDDMHETIQFGRDAGEDVSNVENRYHNLLQKHNRWKAALGNAKREG